MRNPIGRIVVATLLMLPVSALAQGVKFTNSPSPGTVGIVYSFQFTASGATSFTYSCQCTNPAPGLTLSNTGAITGTPTASGNFMFNAEVADARDSENNSGFVTMSIQIGAQPLTINATSVMDATRGVLYSNPLSASGGTGGYSWSLSGGALPGGLSVNPGGSIGGTPFLADTAGLYKFTVEVMDSSKNIAFQSLSMTLHNPAMTLSPASLLPGIVNGMYSSGMTASGGAGPPTPYTYSWSGTTPPGLMLNTATGAITGAPTATGTFNFTISVTDMSSFTPPFIPQNYSITVYPVITIAPLSIPSADAGSNYSQMFTASGGSGSGYTYSIVGTPPGMSFNTSTGVLSGPPSSGGPFTITAHDSAGFSGSQNYTLSVNPALTLTPTSLNSGQVGTAYSQNFTAGGGSGIGYSFSMSGSSVPGLNLIGNNLGGTPTKGGTYMFSITAKDSLGYAITNPYTLSIAPPIQVMPGSIPSGQVGVSYSQQTFSATGGNGGPYTFSANNSNPFGLTFNASTATLSGTPTTFGSMTLTVTASDGTIQGHTDYTLTIAPAALTLSPSTTPNGIVGTAYSQQFTASGGLGTYTFSIIGTQPPGLGLTSSGATTTLGGTPTTAGSYSFSVQVSDGSKTASQTFTGVTISNPPLTLGPATLPPGIVNGSYSATFTATGGSGNVQAYTYSINGSTPGLTLNTSSGVLSGTPTSVTTYNFTIGVSDGSQFTPPFSVKSYSIVVEPPITIAPVTIPNADLNVNYSQSFTASGGSGSGYSYSISALPAGMSFNAASGTLSGPPSASGPSPFTITAKDSVGLSGTSATFTLTVNPALTLSPSTLLSAQIGAGFSQAFTASGGSGGYSYSLLGTPPPGLGLLSNVLSGTPTTSGTFSFSITAHDSLGGSVTTAYSLTIANPPIVVSPTTIPSGQVGVNYSQGFSANGGNGGPYTYSISGGSLFGLGFNAGTATLSGTPTGAGTSTITISASDGTLNGQRSYTLTVNPSGLTLSPSAIGGGTVGVKYSQSFAATGGSGSYTFTLNPSNPSGLTFSSNGATATLSGTPTTFGSLPLTLQLSDGTSTVSRNYTLAISAQALSITTTTLPPGQAGVSYAASLSATGGTAPYTWTITSNTLPVGLFLTANNGAITGTPSTAGSFSFGVTVTDSAGITASTTLSIAVQPAALMFTTTSPLPPALSGVKYSAGLGASGGTPPYTFALTSSGVQGLGITGSTLSGTLVNAGSTAITYNLTIKVSDSAGGSLSSGFQLTVQPASAGLILSAGSLALKAVSQGPSPLPQYVSVNSTTQGSVAFSVATDQSWLSASPGGGNTPATLQVNVNQAGLSPGVNMGNVTVTGADGPHTVAVSLQVNAAPPQLSVVPTIVSFVTDGVVQPGAGSIQVSNIGGGSFTFTASVVNGSSWINLGSFSTTVTSTAPVSIPVSAVITGLMVGDYRDVVHIDSSAGTANVPVTLLVAGGSTINLVPSASLFSSRQGQGISNGTRSFQIVTTGNMPVNWAASLVGGSGWLTLNTPNGTSTSDTPGIVSYTVDPTNLGTGSYYARIHIDAPTATNTPVDFVVVSSVEAASTPAEPDPTPAGALFVSSPGSPAPPAQIITINTSSISPITFTAAANTFTGGNWLSAAPTTGMTSTSSPGQVSVTINASGMATGIYQGGVSFTLQGNPTGVRTVSIVLIVTGSSQSPTLISRLDRLEPRATCNPAKLVALQTGLASNFSTPAGWPIALAIQLADDCGNAVANGSVVASFSNGDAPLALQLSDTKHAVYSATWNPHGTASQVAVSASASAPSLQSTTAQIIGTVSPNQVPILYKHGTIHNLNPLPGAPLAPGTIVQIYGSSLAPSVQQTSLPLPINVNGTIAIIGGISAPLYYVSDGQLDAQLPLELNPGRQYQILISANGALTTPDTIDIEPVTPGVAAALDGTIVAQHADASYVTPASPAHPGEILTIYLAGMGVTDVPVMTGAQSPSDPLAHPMVLPTVMVNGEQAVMGFAGLTPQAVGLYQINFTVPPDAPSGNLKLEVLQGTAQSNVSTLVVSVQ